MKRCLVAAGILTVSAAIGAGELAVGELGNQPLATLGFVDVTARPFRAAPSGKTDCTTPRRAHRGEQRRGVVQLQYRRPQTAGPEFGLLSIRGTRSPLSFYQCYPEHGRGKAQMEVVNSRHVTFYGVKSEYNEAILAVRDSDHVRVFGYGGNASAFSGRALSRFERTPNFLLANVVDSPRREGSGAADSSPGILVDPRKWPMVIEETTGGKTIRTRPLDSPVLYQRGEPLGAPK